MLFLSENYLFFVIKYSIFFNKSSGYTIRYFLFNNQLKFLQLVHVTYLYRYV